MCSKIDFSSIEKSFNMSGLSDVKKVVKQMITYTRNNFSTLHCNTSIRNEKAMNIWWNVAQINIWFVKKEKVFNSFLPTMTKAPHSFCYSCATSKRWMVSLQRTIVQLSSRYPLISCPVSCRFCLVYIYHMMENYHY